MDLRDDTLVEMAYRWADIETVIEHWVYNLGKPDEQRIGIDLAPALRHAFRVEATVVDEGLGINGDLYYGYGYEILYDVENKQARESAKLVRDNLRAVRKAVKQAFSGAEHDVDVRVVSAGSPAMGQVCGRPWEPPPKPHIDVSDVPIERPDSNVPLTERDGYWLTPIEVPFYDALRETGLIFAVQPWIQGVERRYRLDFLIFYDGGMVAVELDGHETHKTKRAADARCQKGPLVC